MARSASISTAKAIAVYEYLKKILTRSEDGTFCYHEEWTDRRVAHEFDVGVASVQKIRQEQFGPLSDKASTTVRLSPAEQAVARALGMSAFEYAQNKILLVSEGMLPTPGEAARLKKVEEMEQAISDMQRRIDRLEEIILLQGKMT